MSGNREIPQLSTLAFEALLKYRNEYISPNDYEAEIQNNPVVRLQMKKNVPSFLQCIANADLDETKKFLEKNPFLAIFARGTVTTFSGYTYENVSAIQLAYLMNDIELCNIMLSYIKDLSIKTRKKATDQLAQKMVEVKKQQAKFKPYDFSRIATAIVADQTLKDTGQPNPVTKTILKKFKEDFKPHTIKEGKSWINEHLLEACRVYRENLPDNRDNPDCWIPFYWSANQTLWYFANIIGHLETLVEKCFELECSQGLREFIEKKPMPRKFDILSNHINHSVVIKYRGTSDSSLLLGRDFFVEFYYGMAISNTSTMPIFLTNLNLFDAQSLKIIIELKNRAWERLINNLSNNTNLAANSCRII